MTFITLTNLVVQIIQILPLCESYIALRSFNLLTVSLCKNRVEALIDKSQPNESAFQIFLL